MRVQNFQLIVPRDMRLPGHALIRSGRVQVFDGCQAVTLARVSVKGAGVTASGTLKGDFVGYDFRDLFRIFQLTDTSTAGDWFAL